MAKKKSSSNDINSILSQLKKSYNIDGNQDPEEDIFESESYEDTELTSLLAKIIAENTFEPDAANSDITELHKDEEQLSSSDKPKKNKNDAEGEHKPEPLIITSEDFVSVLEDGEDISEGAKYTIPHPPLRKAAKDELEDDEDAEEEDGDITEEELSIDFPEASNIEDEIKDDENFDGPDKDVLEDITFGELEDELPDEIDEDEDINKDIEDVTFGELEDDYEDEAEADDESDENDELTFGDIEDEENEDNELTFGDIEDEENEDNELTFGDIEDDDSEDDGLTFGDLEGDCDIDGEPADVEDTEDNPIEDSDGIEGDGEAAQEDEEDFSVIPTVEAITEEIEAKSDLFVDIDADDEYSTPEKFEQPRKSYYDILEKEEREMSEDEDVIESSNTENQGEATACEDIFSEDGIADEEKPYIADKYTDDPLQWHFTRKIKVTLSEIVDDDEGEPSGKTSEIQDDDISLLLQLGYRDELKEEVGQERTDSVVQSISNSYRPDRHRIPFGFCGKEFSEKDQIEKIKQRYDYDKRMIIIKTALFSAIAFVLLLLGIFFKTRAGISSTALFPLIELCIMALGCIVIYKELIAGIAGIFKFTPTLFTIPIFSLVILVIYDVFAIVVSSSSGMMDARVTPLFGFTTALFFVSSLVSELFNCTRERRTFNLISSSEDLYAGEMLVSKDKKSDTDSIRTHELRKQIKGEAVIIKKTKYISEYFKRSSESTYSILNVALTIGVVLLVSMILAYIVIAAQNDAKATDVASTIIFTIYMCLSASFILSMPMMLYAAQSSLKRKNSAFVGTSAINEYSKVSTVIFPDTAAFNVGSDIEIIPFGDGDIKNDIKTANRLLYSLGGTLGKTAVKESYSPDNSLSAATVNIVVINNDGVELYMDNDTHILLGNEKFMSSYRKRLNFEACDFISKAKTRDREAVYLAINWRMSLGYIVTLKLKKSFIGVLEVLSSASMRAMVSTYEPHIKPIHVSEIDIGVYKPYDYGAPEKSIPRFGGIVAYEDSTNIIYPLIMSKEITARKKKLSLISLIFVLAGGVVSFAITLIGYLVSSAHGILGYRDILTAVIQSASIIPIIVHSVGIYKKFK